MNIFASCVYKKDSSILIFAVDYDGNEYGITSMNETQAGAVTNAITNRKTLLFIKNDGPINGFMGDCIPLVGFTCAKVVTPND